jgi:hypothetical protein
MRHLQPRITIALLSVSDLISRCVLVKIGLVDINSLPKESSVTACTNNNNNKNFAQQINNNNNDKNSRLDMVYQPTDDVSNEIPNED